MGDTMNDDKQTTESGEPTDSRLPRRSFLGAAGAAVGGSLIAGSVAGAPYGGSRHTIPGRIEAEDYDTDGAGVAYNDTTTGNSGGAYRSENVDVEATSGGGYNVGWTQGGEWLNYSATTASAGTYEMTARVASGGGGGSFILQEDQADLATFDVPDTGGWQSWTTVTQQVDLQGGDHMIAVYFDTAGVNLDWLEFSQVGGGSGGSSVSPGTYRITNVNSGKALEVGGSGTANGDNAQQWTYADYAHQQWDVQENGDGTYRLINVNSGKALDVANVSTSAGANVHQWDYVGGANQHWRIESNGDGTYQLLADHSGLALDVNGGGTADGTNVQQWTPNGLDPQHWILESVDGGDRGGGVDSGSDNYPNLDGNSWSLTWNDEFDTGSLDTSNWQSETGGGCGQGGRLGTSCSWGNQEEQYYTDGDNAWVENGRLIIEAREETAPNGINPYTSARLNTAGGFQKQHGRIEVRARLPETQGLWPAIWMLGHDIGSVGWPTCGEVDIMELTGDDTTTVHGTVHGPGYSGGGGITSGYSGPDFSDGFHDFTVTWYSDAIKWFVDGQHFYTVTRSEVENAGNNWVFNDEFFIILNIAVGGTLPGYPDASTQFPQRMEVEHVRVYDWV